MLDIGKLIPTAAIIEKNKGFSSMLDIGKLIHAASTDKKFVCFSSMLDIGSKLILKYRSGIDRTFAVARSIME